MQIKELYKKFLKAKGADIKYRNLAAGKKIDVSKKGLWDKKKKQVIVPSNRITMKGPNGEQDFFKKPVVATGLQSGQQVMMQPGGEYYFPNDKAVHEVRMQNGGNILSMGDYDLTTAPKRGDYLLPDINRPSYIDDAGERRTEYKIGINVDGKETLIPTVVGGRQLSNDEAVSRYRKTGLHMGKYNTPKEADYAARSRTAKYNMLEDPIRFQANQFQAGGRVPIYTSNPNDPRLQRFNDSASLHNSNFFIPNKDVFYRSNAELKKSFCKDINCYGLVRDGVKQNKKQKLEYIKGIQPTGYDNFPNKSDYNKGLSTEILFPEPVQPIIYQPSLAVSNIDRDMYTPGGGMAREYNIGVTLQDGSKKAFRTEKEYQDWKAANNLDISKAKVSEGRGYSYDYPENKKYGGWLNQYQPGGEVDIIPTLKQLDPNFNVPKKTVNPIIKEALSSADKATDMLQLGHFSTLPWAQAAGLVGDIAGISVDLAQSGIANYEGNNVDAVGNLAMASVPLLGNSVGYERSRSLISGTSPGNYRPLSPLTPAHAANPVIAKGLAWNKALLAANVGEIMSNMNSNTYATQRVPQRDNAQVQFRPNPSRPKMAEGGWLDEFQDGGSVQTDITTPIRKKPSPSQDAFDAMLAKYEASKEAPEEDASVPEDMGFQSGGELPVVIDSLFSNFRSGIGRKYAQNGMAVPGVNGTVVANTNAPINSEKLKMQTGAWANWTPNTEKPYLRTSPAGNAGYSDNTKVVTQNTNVSAANRKAAEAAPHTKEDSFINSVEATLNPYNWGVTDYTKSGTRAQAFSAARKAGEKEFMWNNERFNTRKDTDPIKYTGANPNQEEYDEVLRTQYPEFFKLLNRGQNVGNISFEGSESLNGEFNRAFIQKNPNLLFSGNSKVAVGQNPHSSHEFISNLIAEAGHLKDNKLDKNILNPYTWKAALDDFKFGETKYNIPGTAEYNAHRLIEPGVSMVAYGNLSPNDVKRIQKNLGVEEDGYFGETTYKALQNKYKDNDYIQRGVAMHEYRTQDTDENPIGTGHYSNLSKRYLHELNKEVPLKYYDRFSEDTKRSDYTDAALLSTSGDNMNTLLLQHALKKRGYALPKSTINKPSNYNWSDSRYYNLDGKYGEETKNALLDWQNKNSTKKQNGGWLNSYEVGGEVPFDVERMQGVDIRKKRSWSDKLKGYVNQFEKKIGLDPYNERSDDFMEQWARRVNTATGGRDWYKQPNDGSGTGGIGTAMMETVMAPFSAPQLASVYGLTGKVQMPSEALNIQNPVGAFLTDTVLDPLSVLPAAAKLRGPLKSASKYLTTNTALKNTYKYNPLAFKPNPESYYRVMPDAGAEDLINSGFVRPAEGSPTSYFNKGVPLDIRRARTFGNDTREAYHGYKGPYMVESNNPNAFDPWLQFPEPSLKFYQTKAPIPASDIKLYKEDWLKGYKQIKKPGLKKGGEIDHDDDKDMVNGVASILRRVKNPENRLQLANQLSKQFNREKVKYDLPSFLAKSKVKK